MTDFKFLRNCKKAIEMSKSLYLEGALSVNGGLLPDGIHMREKVFLEMFPTYTQSEFLEHFLEYSTAVNGIKFFCLVEKEKEVA